MRGCGHGKRLLEAFVVASISLLESISVVSTWGNRQAILRGFPTTTCSSSFWLVHIQTNAYTLSTLTGASHEVPGYTTDSRNGYGNPQRPPSGFSHFRLLSHLQQGINRISTDEDRVCQYGSAASALGGDPAGSFILGTGRSASGLPITNAITPEE